jgi:hypothetical protein
MMLSDKTSWHHDIVELLHVTCAAPQVLGIERQATPALGLPHAATSGTGVNRTDMSALQDRAVPGAVAGRAFVDQPRVDTLAVLIYPYPLATSEGF